jgi:hypothetical protein
LDVSTSPGFSTASTTLTISDCNDVTSSTVFYWWDSTTAAWVAMSGDPGPSYTSDVGDPGQLCVSYTLNSSTTPSVSQLSGTVIGVANSLPVISRVTFSGSSANPRVTITGSGFGGAPLTVTPGCNSTGEDYVDEDLYLRDYTSGWEAGIPGNCFGLVVSTYTNTEISFTLGSYYYSYYNMIPHLHLSHGDQFAVGVNGATATAIVAYPKITSITISGSTTAPTVTIIGTGLGSGPAGAIVSAGCGGSGSDYLLDELYLSNTTNGWLAGLPGDCVGLNVCSYTNTSVVFTFGDLYHTNGWVLSRRSHVIVGVAGATKAATVRVG